MNRYFTFLLVALTLSGQLAADEPKFRDNCLLMMSRFSKNLLSIPKAANFSKDFVLALRKRTKEISADPELVKSRLRESGQLAEFPTPQGKHSLKFEGTMDFYSSFGDFFRLWSTFLNMNRGAAHDYLFTDVVNEFADRAKKIPIFDSIPVVQKDRFYGEIIDGKMVSFVEVVDVYGFGILPVSTSKFVFKRPAEAAGANPFEHAIDRHRGDMSAVQKEYRDLYIPQRYLSGTNADIAITMTQRKIDFTEKMLKPLEGVEHYDQRNFLPFGVPLP
ncbi:hypothetical protein N9D31_02475 [Oligoflexaceae bacterium]|nr:hypothetical protein [Oligoflexaceae bacterium]